MLKVFHFVTGGFSGATQLTIDLALAELREGSAQPTLILRRKRNTDEHRLAALRSQGLTVEVVPGWAHLATVAGLMRLCRQYQPDVMVAHGFPEHLLGRFAGLLAGVPRLVLVEHNSRERYSWWRKIQARWLATHTDRFIAVSEGVGESLRALGMPADRTRVIPNGIDLARFAKADQAPYAQRIPGLVMASRFARQKDHATLLRALALLKARGLRPSLLLAGQGKRRHVQGAVALCKQLGVDEQVQFIGHSADLPALLLSHQIGVLSTHYEGMPLSMVESMAAGMAVVGSDVVGVRELIQQGVNGYLVPESDPLALANALFRLLSDPAEAAKLASNARRKALAEHGRELTQRRYDAVLAELFKESAQL